MSQPNLEEGDDEEGAHNKKNASQLNKEKDEEKENDDYRITM